MRRIILLAALLAAAYVPQAARAQFARGGYLMAGQGAGGNGLVDARFAVDMAYTIEAGGHDGPYVGGRGTLGIHWLRADQEAFRARYGGEAEGGGGTLYDTGGDVEVGYGVGVLRVYGFTGIHYYQQFQDPATVRGGGEEVEVTTRRRETIANGSGAGVYLRLADTGGFVGEWYRGGGQDGVMRLSGTRFGLRWAW
ncbi:hypothetical protein [Longimicrobium sp.]|uniref:hypothetical protein n=1 Tax=Longimicrobium sp. TaxID=2029185 RepID=UPI002E34C7C3|nr:hypothetical protein [Longimicrobium sp.]HEX6039345.1 hypothetical protein [Longimicrobium sp.]